MERCRAAVSLNRGKAPAPEDVGEGLCEALGVGNEGTLLMAMFLVGTMLVDGKMPYHTMSA